MRKSETKEEVCKRCGKQGTLISKGKNPVWLHAIQVVRSTSNSGMCFQRAIGCSLYGKIETELKDGWEILEEKSCG